jgi:hypothetical protein
VFFVKVVVTNSLLEKIIALVVQLDTISLKMVQHTAFHAMLDCINRKKHNQNAKNVPKIILQICPHKMSVNLVAMM